MRLSSSLPFVLFTLATRGDAAHFPLLGRLGSTSPNLQRRTSLNGTMSQLDDSRNLRYTTNITLNGEPFSVMIDTGSSDLWVSSSVPGAVPQNFQAGVGYASGSATGNVMSATLEFAGFSIDSQFFIEAPNGTGDAGAAGLIGLGPSSSSSIRTFGNSSAANPPLDRIFTSNSSVSPQIAVLLQRLTDPEEPFPGDLAVGEVLSNYTEILQQPRHAVTLAPLQGGQHWQTLLDVNGIIGPNGKPIEIKTQVTGAQTQNATVVFDTGFTLPQVPSSVAQALYGNIPNAVLTNVSTLGELWVLPCDQEVNATFLFAGVEFPIHPLDMSLSLDELGANIGSKSVCIGGFQPYSFDIEEGGDILYDMILGMAFLRNAYLLINFGDLVDAATPSTDTAYIQLLPITNATQASQDFARVRKGSSKSWKPLLIGLITGVGLLLVLFVACIICCCCRRRRTKNTRVPGIAWVKKTASYQPIDEPSPQAAYDMHMARSTPEQTSRHAPQYKTAWDADY